MQRLGTAVVADDGVARAPLLGAISRLETQATERFADKLVVNPQLNRRLVSYQANKRESGYRWYTYKEGFSSALVHYILAEEGISSGALLDPFAGSGTALFAACDSGLDAVGIELLPVGVEVMEVRKLVREVDPSRVAASLQDFARSRVWETRGKTRSFGHLRITAGAFPTEVESTLGRFLFEADSVADATVSRILRFAAMCVLESVSYTRKDGQYLRWDCRSGRRVGRKPFDKGRIPPFSEAIRNKIEEIVGDIRAAAEPSIMWPRGKRCGSVEVLQGSCLDILPRLQHDTFDIVVTSPPYCNRYDYTRTYALELAMLGADESGIRALRQDMLSCTVENRCKAQLKARFQPSLFEAASSAWSSHELLQLIVNYLETSRARGELNNNGIPRMVANYFLEMALVIFECARVLRRGSLLAVVNDNVRYHGVAIPVDLILSDIAAKAGFEVEVIWVLPRGKGNSSQQMGKHGKRELRKCVYLWRLTGA